MTTLTNKLNQIWYKTDGDTIRMGLTRSFLDQLDECWHILPPNGRIIKEKSPLFTIETNDSLVSVLSPVAGNFLSWNDRATNFPDKLTDMDVLIELSTKPVKVPVASPIDALVFERERFRDIENDASLTVNTRIRAQRQRHDIEAQINERGTVVNPAAAVRNQLRPPAVTIRTAGFGEAPAPRRMTRVTNTATGNTFAAFTDNLGAALPAQPNGLTGTTGAHPLQWVDYEARTDEDL